MSHKKPNVFNQLLCVFQRKKCVYDDIVTAADKVVEEYICNKNTLIRREYIQKRKKRPGAMLIFFSAIALGVILIGIVR